MKHFKSHKEKILKSELAYHLTLSALLVKCLFPTFIFAKQKKKSCTEGKLIINETIYQSPGSHQGDFGICYAHSSVAVYRALLEELYSTKAHLSTILLAFHSFLDIFKIKGLDSFFFLEKKIRRRSPQRSFPRQR